MPTPLNVVQSDTAALHVPGAEIWLGLRTPGTEVPERANAICTALPAHRAVAATPHDDADVLAVHDAGLVEFLRTAWPRWTAAGFVDLGADRVVPYLFPEVMLGGRPAAAPASVHAETGRWCFDTMTLIGPGTWAGARGAVDTALTAVDLVCGGERVAYALTRPPGHHVTRSAYGGSCYLNNAAVAAAALLRAGHTQVAVIDIDAHHGNGTQDIFYERADVTFGSVHVDPAAGWFPHYCGFADETGSGAGAGATLNMPIAPGSGDAVWLLAVTRLVEHAAKPAPSALVVSLGVDATAHDPESPLEVTDEGYAAAGALLAQLDVPVVVVQEGGYDLPTLGGTVAAALRGLTR